MKAKVVFKWWKRNDTHADRPFCPLLFLFFLRGGFEQDVENGYPHYPDSCHGKVDQSSVLNGTPLDAQSHHKNSFITSEGYQVHLIVQNDTEKVIAILGEWYYNEINQQLNSSISSLSFPTWREYPSGNFALNFPLQMVTLNKQSIIHLTKNSLSI